MFNYYKDAFSNILYICPSNFQDVFNSNKIDLFLFVTCWHGLSDQEWSGITFTESLQSILEDILRICKNQGIPTVFQSIEDPSNYKKFINIAKHFEYIFTSDIHKIEDYKKDCNLDHVYYGEYGVNPLFNNTIGHRNYRINGAFFAGSYPARYKERCHDMESMFDDLIHSGSAIAIADRQSDSLNEGYRFPKRFSPFVIPKIEHKTLQKIHKLFRYNINFNSIKHSMTMCAMRVYELQAQGSLLLSNYAMSVANRFPNIRIHHDREDHSNYFQDGELNRFSEYEREVRSSLTILSNKTVFEQSAAILSIAGLPTLLQEHTILVLCVELSEQIITSFKHQTYRFRILRTLEDVSSKDWLHCSFVAYFSSEIDYESDYLNNMVCSFKFTNSKYVTKNSYFSNGSIIDGIQNNFTNNIESICLTVFSRKDIELAQITHYIKTNERLFLPDGYSTNPYGANYISFYRRQFRSLQTYIRDEAVISIVVPISGIGELMLYRLMDGLRSNKLFDKFDVILWVPENIAVAPGSLLSIIIESHSNFSVFRRDINIKVFREILNQCTSNIITIRDPGVQYALGDLDKLAASYKQCASKGVSPHVVLGFESVVGENTKNLGRLNIQVETTLSISDLASYRELDGAFSMNTSLFSRKWLADILSSDNHNNNRVEDFRELIYYRLLKNASIVHYIDTNLAFRYESNALLADHYEVHDIALDNYAPGYPIYFLYAGKWNISASWSGAAVNVINEMYILSLRYSIYYNDIYINDLFSGDGVLDEQGYFTRYNHIINIRQPAMSAHLKKIIKPSRV